MRRSAALAAAFLVSLAAAAPHAAAQPRDTLTIGMTQFPSTMHPLIDSMAAKSYVLYMTRRPITAYDENWKLVCMLCTTLPTLENGLAKEVDLGDGKKGMQLTVSLHPKATWGDGTPVTVKDVIFTWEIGKHPKSGVGEAELFRRILKIEPKDDKTFTLTLDRVTFQYNNLSGFQLLPAHLEAKPAAEPAEYKTRTTFDADPTNAGLGFGPYRMTQFVAGSHMVFEPNPTWYGKKPHFKRIVVRVIGNTQALEANLLSGGIDYIAGELGLTIDQALAMEKRHAAKFRFVYKPGLIYEHMDVNLEHPILKDKRVRQALLMAIDREKIVKQLFEGKQPVAHSSVSPLDGVADPNVKKYPYDPAAAKALLDAAGWTEMKNGVRHNKAGDKLAFTLMTTAGNSTRELVQAVLQSEWKQIGVEVRIQNQPARVFFGQTVTQRKYEGLALFAWISSPENVPLTTLHSSHITTAEKNWSGQNYTGYSNPEMDTLIEAIEKELNFEKRKALWHRLQAIYAEDLPALPLFFRADVFVLPPWLEGVVPTGHQYYTTLWVENWSAK
jgi:peptide/nickel transport system substrate-binding protein